MGQRRFGLRDPEVFEHGRLPNVHPGQILREEFLEPLNLTAYQLARSIKVEQRRISEILNGRRGITADTAWRLSRFFGTTPDLWMNLQSRYELLKAEDEIGERLRQIEPLGVLSEPFAADPPASPPARKELWDEARLKELEG